jgi:hypothetical protein
MLRYLIAGTLGVLAVLSLLFFYSPKDSNAPTVGCTISACHAGIEHTSENHKFPCVDCHAGNNQTADKETAHTDMLGGRNPSDHKVWDKTCGLCHKYQLDRVKTTLMFTATGMIKNSQLAWDDFKGKLYSAHGTEGFDSKGEKFYLPPVEELDELSGELYRKFCSSCHVGYDKLFGYRSHHSSGCASCHFNHSDSGRYTGKDQTIYGKGPYPETHEMSALPTNDVCMTCHNRSGRIALSYEGLYDGNNSLVPTKDGYPGPELMSGVRNLRHMEADIHHDKGIECIDCHTSRDIMGDGYIYENMFLQIETACEDCHGTETSMPKTAKVTSENDEPVRESANYAFDIKYGDEMVLTSKGRMYSNVKKEGDKYFLYTKRKGKKIEIKTVYGSGDHSVNGHERLECYTCHSKTVVQCYGCHTTYDKREKMFDLIKGKETYGAFSEKEDFRSFFPFPLGLNQRGKISPVTPGCQTFLTAIDKNGNKILDEHIFNFRKEKKFKFAPFYSHNTGEKAVSCSVCHSQPAFAGFGQGIVSVENGDINSSYMCEKCDKPLDSLYSLEGGKMSVTSDIVRKNSRLLNQNEIIGMFKANKCIVCHDKGDKKIYGSKIDYDKILSDSVHRPLLSE